MRSIAICAMFVLAACANNDGQTSGRSGLNAERDACQARIAASPEFQALEHRLRPDGFAMGSNGNKATPAEAAQMVTLHQDYLRPCQEIDLEIAGRTHPSLPAIYNAAAAKADANIANLVTYKISWREYVRNSAAVRIDLNAQLAAARVALGLRSLNQLDQPRPTN
jgi:hypothetical protein